MIPHSHAAPVHREVLGELLHSVSQPLTTLRCSLELSLDEEAEQLQQSVTVALEQTENVIGMIQLMREYLEVEQDDARAPGIALTPVLQTVTEDLSVVAAARNIRMGMTGTCTAEMPMTYARMQMALYYLISAMIEQQPSGGEIKLLLADDPPGSVVRIQGERGLAAEWNDVTPRISEVRHRSQQLGRSSVKATLRRAQLAIATRILEDAGAALSFDDGAPGVTMRIPRTTS